MSWKRLLSVRCCCTTAEGCRALLNRWYYAADSHHFSLVLKAEVMRAYYISRTLLHLHLISFNALIATLPFLSKQQLFQPPEAVFASFPIKPSQRNPADVLHNASKMQVKAELAETMFHSLTDVSTFTVCRVSLSQNRASFCLCALAAGPWSVPAAALEQSAVSSLPIASSSSPAKTGNSGSIA